MRRLPRTLLPLLALGLIVNGPVAAFAATSSDMANAMHDLPAQTGEDSAPCHEQPDQERSTQDPSQQDCCEHGGCLCILGAAGVAVVDAPTDRQFAPQHFPSISALTAGHPQLGPALLLRPPIA